MAPTSLVDQVNKRSGRRRTIYDRSPPGWDQTSSRTARPRGYVIRTLPCAWSPDPPDAVRLSFFGCKWAELEQHPESLVKNKVWNEDLLPQGSPFFAGW